MFAGELTGWINTAVLFVSVIMALTQCFLGFRFVKFWVGLAGFLTGAYLGYLAVSAGLIPENYGMPARVLTVIAAGAAVSLFSYKLFKAGLFLFCGALAARAVSLIPLREGDLRNMLGAALGIGAFILAGYLAVKFFRTAVIAVTAVGGAWIAARGLGELLPGQTVLLPHQLSLFAALAAAGIIVQLLTTRRE